MNLLLDFELLKALFSHIFQPARPQTFKKKIKIQKSSVFQEMIKSIADRNINLGNGKKV